MSAARHGSGKPIAFARHGETAWTGNRFTGQSDLPLTDHGRASAETLAVRVARSGVLEDPASVIVASPLRRARETAAIVAKAVDRPVHAEARWMEAGFGSVEGLTFDEGSAAWPAVFARLAAGDAAIDWPGGETWLALHQRVAAALDDVLARDVPVLVVGHGIAMYAAFTVLTGAHVDRSSLPGLPPGGLVTATWSGSDWILEAPQPGGDRA